jgi:1-acyl-sn-glycerol-3-phosphate acyltransferase
MVIIGFFERVLWPPIQIILIILEPILLFPLRIIASIILFVMGWLGPDESFWLQLRKYPQSVVIFSHTSYADFYLMILYLLKYPEALDYLRVIIKPQPFAYAGWLLRGLGGIPATPVEEKNGRSTDGIINELRAQGNFALLICPKGTIVKREWRSGYLVIAREFQAPIMVAGLDYEKKQPVISEAISSKVSDETIVSFAREQLATIVPLFPEEEVVTIREHDPKKRGILDLPWFTLCLVYFLCLLTFWLL